MADSSESVQIKINLALENADSASSIKEIKASIKSLKEAALEVGQGSKGFDLLIARAGKLQDEINDVSGSVQVLAGNAVENLTNSFSRVATAGVGGFQAIAGAQAVFGAESEDLQKQLVKLQGLLSLSQGIKEFANIGQAARDFGTVIRGTAAGLESASTAQKTLNAVMAASPIFIIAGILTAVVYAIDAFTNGTEEADTQQKEFNKTLTEANEKLVEMQAEYKKVAIDIDVVNGKLTKEAGDRLKNEIDVDSQILQTKKELQARILKIFEETEAKTFDDIETRGKKEKARKEEIIAAAKLFENQIAAIRKIGAAKVKLIEDEEAKKKKEKATQLHTTLLEFIKQEAEQGRKINVNQTLEQAKEQSKRIQNIQSFQAKAAELNEQLENAKNIADQTDRERETSAAQEQIEANKAKLKAEYDYLEKSQNARIKADIENRKQQKINDEEDQKQGEKEIDDLKKLNAKRIAEYQKTSATISSILGSINNIITGYATLAQAQTAERVRLIERESEVQLQSLQYQRDTDLVNLENSKNEELRILQGNTEAQLDNAQLSADERSAINDDYQRKKDAIEQNAARNEFSRVQAAAKAEYAIKLSAYKTETEIKQKAFEQEKKLRIAQTIITSAQGVLAAFSQSIAQLGPITGVIVGGALSTAITTLAVKQVQFIQSQKFDAGTAPTAPAPVAAPTFGANTGSNNSSTSQAKPTSELFGTQGKKNNLGGSSSNSAFSVNVNVGVSEVTSTQAKVAKFESASSLGG